MDQSQSAQLRCPKCQQAMNRYERNGVHVDQCTGCGGLFLDRGELEQLTRAEASYYAQQAPAPAMAAAAGGEGYDTRSADDRRYDERRYDDRRNDDRRNGDRDRDFGGYRSGSRESHRYDGRGREEGYPRKRKKKGFLEDLLDFGG